MLNHSLPIYKMEIMLTSTIDLGLGDYLCKYILIVYSHVSKQSKTIFVHQKPKARKEKPARDTTLSKVRLFAFLTE